MMGFYFCTITTNSHLFKVNALFESLSQINPNCTLFVLNIDASKATEFKNKDRLIWIDLDEIKSDLSGGLVEKYKHDKNKIRWSLKPVFLKYLLEADLAEKLIYVDNDIAFFGDYSFLFEALTEFNVLLTPHNYPRFTDTKQNWLEANFRVGLYNAGFIGVNKKALDLLDWWANCCLYRCEKNSWRGLFDDQKYLDLVPIIEPMTLVLQHKGCNLAEWNRDVCIRSYDNESQRVLINNKWPVVFIHFNITTLKCFHNNEDILLKPFYDTYKNWLLKFKPSFDMNSEIAGTNFWPTLKFWIWNFLNTLNTKLQ